MTTEQYEKEYERERQEAFKKIVDTPWSLVDDASDHFEAELAELDPIVCPMCQAALVLEDLTEAGLDQDELRTGPCGKCGSLITIWL